MWPRGVRFVLQGLLPWVSAAGCAVQSGGVRRQNSRVVCQQARELGTTGVPCVQGATVEEISNNFNIGEFHGVPSKNVKLAVGIPRHNSRHNAFKIK